MGFILHFHSIFGTNLLTGGPVLVSVFLPILEFRRKGIPNGMKLCDDLSWTVSKLEDLDLKSGTPRGGHKAGGRARCGVGAPPPSWAPRNSTDVLLPPIYTLIP